MLWIHTFLYTFYVRTQQGIYNNYNVDIEFMQGHTYRDRVYSFTHLPLIVCRLSSALASLSWYVRIAISDSNWASLLVNVCDVYGLDKPPLKSPSTDPILVLTT